MNNSQLKLSRIFLFALIGFISSVIIVTNKGNAQTMESYKVIDVTNEIADGKEKEVKMLFEGERRKIAQITLRNEMRLESHSFAEPFILQCIAGKGELIIGEGETAESNELLPGTYITVEANVLHDVVSQPAISILLIRFPEE
jgi:quercetin dioxygenase-like cupin family protein